MMHYADFGNVLEIIFFLGIIVVTLVVRGIKAAHNRAEAANRELARSRTSGDRSRNAAYNHDHWQEDHAAFDFEWDQAGEEWSVSSRASDQAVSRVDDQPETAGPGQGESGAPAAFSESGKVEPKKTDFENEIELGADEVNSMEQAMAAAFPGKGRVKQRIGVDTGRFIHLRIKGSNDLRRAVLIKEVLGQPRAFDL